MCRRILSRSARHPLARRERTNRTAVFSRAPYSGTQPRPPRPSAMVQQRGRSPRSNFALVYHRTHMTRLLMCTCACGSGCFRAFTEQWDWELHSAAHVYTSTSTSTLYTGSVHRILNTRNTLRCFGIKYCEWGGGEKEAEEMVVYVPHLGTFAENVVHVLF